MDASERDTKSEFLSVQSNLIWFIDLLTLCINGILAWFYAKLVVIVLFYYVVLVLSVCLVFLFFSVKTYSGVFDFNLNLKKRHSISN